MGIFKRVDSNDATGLIREKVRIDKRTYGKYGAVVNAINENTNQLKELVEEIQKFRATH